MRTNYRYSIVACARWESLNIVEWLNYYRAIGFDHVFLYCNDDHPADLYEKVLPFINCENPFITFRFFPFQGQQEHIYNHFLKNDREKTEWVAFFDIDEYLRLSSFANMPEFMQSLDRDTDCILFNWLMFGPNGYKTNAAGPTLSSYTRRHADIHPYTKYIIRASLFAEQLLERYPSNPPFWHFPTSKINLPVKMINVIGEDMNHYYENFPDSAIEFLADPVRKENILGTAIIHHYALRSEGAFVERVRRGLKGSFAGQITWKNLSEGGGLEDFLAELAAVEDFGLASFWPSMLKRAESTNILPPPHGKAVSSLKKATQSSVSVWSLGATIEEDACGALNGVIDGTGKFHCDLEDSPWWMVDLERLYEISEVRIFNRLDNSDVALRAVPLTIEISPDGECFTEHCRHYEFFGGIDGNPLIWRPDVPIFGRFVRVGLLQRQYFHLDQVEIYSVSKSEDAPPRSFGAARPPALTLQTQSFEKLLATPQNFDEQSYLRANPDVASAVAIGQFRLGPRPFRSLWMLRGQIFASV